MSVPSVRADMIGVMVFRRAPGVEFLQLLRAARPGKPAAGTWQPVMGGVEAGETGTAAAARELGEEVGLRAGDAAWLGFWSLGRVRPFYVAAQDTVWLMPMFAAEVSPGWKPTLNSEHTDFRWVAHERAGEMFVWPEQAAACREIVEWLLRPGSACEPLLRIDVV